MEESLAENENSKTPATSSENPANRSGPLPFEQRRKQRDGQLDHSTTNNNSAGSTTNTAGGGVDADASSVERPQRHHRGVSWGGVSVEELSRHDSEDSKTAAEEAYKAAEAALSERNQVEGVRHKKLSEAGKINLEDLWQVHPYETEAEAHILQAIEHRDATAQIDGVFTGDVTLLGNVPEGAEGIFTSPPSEHDSGSVSGDQPSSQRTRGFSISTYNDDDDDPSDAHHSLNFTTPIVDMVWDDSDMGNTMHAGNTAMNRHRRQKTMEHNLASLTNALDDLHRQNRPRSTMLDSKPIGSKANQPDLPQSSADAFRQNVSILFRNHHSDNPVAPPAEAEPLLVSRPNGTAHANVNTDGTESGPHDPDHSSVSSPLDNDDDDDELPGGSSGPRPLMSPGRSDKARKNWSLLKEAIIQGGPAAAADFEGPASTGSSHMSTIHEDGTPEERQDIEMGGTTASQNNGNGKKLLWASQRNRRKFRFVSDIDTFLQPRRRSIWIFTKAMLWLILPSLGAAFILFYLANNPATGVADREAEDLVNADGDPISSKKASASWWLLFIGVRQVITFSIARFMEAFVVDFLCLEHRWSLPCFGPTVTLLIVQSKGWPCILFFWSILNLGLLCGDHSFAAHWGYWQDWLEIFNESNPSGDIVTSSLYLRITLIVLGASCVVAIKRLLIGFHQGRKIFAHYAEDLAKVMKKILLVSQVAALAVRLEKERILEGDGREDPNVKARLAGLDEAIDEEVGENEDQDSKSAVSGTSQPSSPSVPRSETKSLLIADTEDGNDRPDFVSRSQKLRLERLLGNWEEPEPEAFQNGLNDSISIASILQFRTSMAQLGRPFPFGYSFGRAATREECIESAQNTYLRLLAETPGETLLSFNILALVALQSDGTLVPEKIRDLSCVFRPSRKGDLTLLNFCKSVDSVYKELRLLRASVRNAQKIDNSFERIFNIVFYTIILCVGLALLGLNPLALFLSLSSFALAFSFMISRASSNYFEGLIFILFHRPYDIGDRIVVQPVESESSWYGATHWVVKDIDLIKTTIVYAYTNEVATLSNGSMANSRIMNGARSPSAIMYVVLRFGIDVTYGQIEIFRDALVRYVETRPRDWAKMWAFRALAVAADKGYVEFLVILEARDSWQELDNLLHIRGQMQSFCHELSKQLDMRYSSPPLPVDLRMRGSLAEALREDEGRMTAAAAGMSADAEAIQRIIQDRNR